MNNTTFKKMLTEALGSDCAEVARVASDSGDNAADMVESKLDGRDNYSAAFIYAWIKSAESLLAYSTEYKAAAPFYASYGIAA